MNIKQLLVNIDFVAKNLYDVLTLKREKEIANLLKRNALMLATVESCTGGLVSSRMTDLSGSSTYIWQNFINGQKSKINKAPWNKGLRGIMLPLLRTSKE